MKSISTSFGILFCIFFAALSGATFAQTPEYEKQVDKLFAAWDTTKTPGATVAVVKDGKTVFKKGYGMANLEYDIPNKPDTIFHIASVSKQFTTFAVLLLEADGKLSLDDDIRKHIPEVPDFGKKITLRHLAHHTSGLRDQWALIAMAGGRLDDVITTEHVMKLVRRQKELNFNPGDEYVYSNTGYTLLAEVVARVSGKSFAEFTNERIFKPLKMRNSFFYDDHEKIVRNRAYSYSPTEKGYKKAVLSYANVGATSLFTTAEDLTSWAVNFENPTVGNKGIMTKMKQKGILNDDREISYALGQSVGQFRGHSFISHSGGDAGYRTYLGRLPDKKLSVMVLSNDGSFNPGQMAQRLLDVFLNEGRTQDAPRMTPSNSKDNKKQAPRISEALLKEYVGSYELSPTFIIKITNENGTLFGEATGQPKLPLVAVSESKFSVAAVGAEISFQRNKDGKVTSLKLDLGGNIQEAKRIESYSPDQTALAEYSGYFYSSELATGYEFVVENGTLIGRHSRLPDIVLRTAKKDFFAGNTWFFGQVEFIRDAKGKIVGCKVSNGRVRNLSFEKK